MRTEVKGVVVRGAGRGVGIGFPTANIELDPSVDIPGGVYAVEVSFDGCIFGGVANVGTHPTVGDSPVRLMETYVFGFSGDLYGKTIRVRLISHIREERRFADIDELRAAISEDVRSAEKVLGR